MKSNFVRFMAFAKGETRFILWGLIGSIFRTLIPLTTPWIVAYTIDHVLTNNQLTSDEKMQKLTFVIIAVVLLFVVVRTPMEFLRQYCTHKFRNNVVTKIRKQLFKKVHDMDAHYFSNTKSGEITTKLFEDVEKAKELLNNVMINVWLDMFSLLLIVGVMFSMNPFLAVIAVSLAPIQMFIVRFFSKRIRQSTETIMKEEAKLKGFLVERVQGALTSKLFGIQEKEQRDFDTFVEKNDQLYDKNAKLTGFTFLSVNIINDLMPYIVIFIASSMVLKGEVTIGVMTAFFAYVEKLRAPIRRLIEVHPTISKGMVAVSRIFDFLDLTPSIKETSTPIKLNQFHKDISFTNVSFSYGEIEHAIFNNLNVTLQKGKTYAFVGESGAGKSTIIQLLTRMYDTSSGTVTIDGTNIQDISFESLRNQIGLVSQDNFLYSFSIKENIRIGKLDATDDEIINAAKKAFAHDFIVNLPNGYDSEVGERGVKLSGGQKQRIALARLFLKNPSIIIFDEATSALDNESEDVIKQSIASLSKDKTVIMIAHRLSTVQHAHRIFVMKEGRIIEQGTHKELLVLGQYYKSLSSKGELIS